MKNPWLSYGIAVLALVAIVFLVFAGVTAFDFVNWDDNIYVYNNPLIRTISPETVSQWFTRPQVKLFVPIPMLSFALDYQNYGLQAGGYHLTNLAFHLLNTLLVFYLLTLVTPNTFWAFLGALLFAVHPAQVETVAWISERKNLLFSFFTLTAFALFATRLDEKRRQNWAVLIFLFAGALFSKITAVVLPLTWLGWDFFQNGQMPGSSSKKYLWLILPAALLGIATVMLYPGLFQAGALSFKGAFLSPFKSYSAYLINGLYPNGLNLFYFDNQVSALVSLIPMLKVLPGIVFLGVLVYGVFQKKEWCFWLFWFFIWLAPVATLLKVPVADHHLYLPLIGLIAFSIRILGRYRLVLPTLLIAANVLCVPLTLARLPVWKNGESLWFSVLRKTPSDFRALLQLADYYQDKGNVGKALGLYQMLATRYPGEPHSHINLVNLCLASGLNDRAEQGLKFFEQNIPGHPEIEVLHAALAEARGQSAQALELLKKSEAKNPDNPAVLLNLGKLYFRAQNFEQSISYFQKVLHANELDAEGNFSLGLSYMAMKQWETAAGQFENMLKKGMYHRGLYFQLGYAYLKTSHRAEAETSYLKSIEWDPTLHEAYYHLGLLKLQDRKPEEAQVFLAQAVALNPDFEPYRKMLDFAQREKQSSSAGSE